MGLHFPPERSGDLERGLAAAAPELGCKDTAQCVERLLAQPLTKAEVQVLASHLTIGETYFFRDPQILAALRDRVLPELIRARRGRDQRLRIWSAASCSGEEPYSLAILLHDLLPDLADWQVTITATDVNPRVLAKAAAGVYREWSFRNTPAGLKERHFQRTPDGGYTIAPGIKKLVSFSYLNLVEDVYPSLANYTNAMDVIFCRNVLMYFTPAQVSAVVRNLHRSLVDGGWLVVSPSEGSQAICSGFDAVNHPGAILYRKAAGQSRPAAARAPAVADALARTRTASQAAPAPAPAAVVAPPTSPRELAEALYGEGRYAEVADMLLATISHDRAGAIELSLLARALANQGRLVEALDWCERWVGVDKLDPAGHYLRASVLLECGNAAEARASLQRAIYLRPDFALAHFALGNLARGRGHAAEAARHLGNALRLLNAREADELLPESDGLTAGRLAEIIKATAALGEPQ